MSKKTQKSSKSPRVALALMAHPDDIELLCAGTLACLVDAGWTVYCATASGGDLGSAQESRVDIRRRRLGEAEAAAAKLGAAGYFWVGLHDLQIAYTPENVRLVTEVVRKAAPDLVITHSPDCYMVDHEETSRLVRAACFGMAIPLWESGETPAPEGKGTPALYYADAIEGKDKFGKPIVGDFGIDVESVFERRQEALKCHESQRDWLRAHHGIDQYLITNEELADHHGASFGVKKAEGFRQHLGHGYPQENVLAEALKKFVRKPVG